MLDEVKEWVLTHKPLVAGLALGACVVVGLLLVQC
jgi:hypothetical protein